MEIKGENSLNSETSKSKVMPLNIRNISVLSSYYIYFVYLSNRVFKKGND